MSTARPAVRKGLIGSDVRMAAPYPSNLATRCRSARQGLQPSPGPSQIRKTWPPRRAQYCKDRLEEHAMYGYAYPRKPELGAIRVRVSESQIDSYRRLYP